MTNISSTQYYQLSNNTSQSSSNPASTSVSTPSLAAALSAADSSTDNTDDSSNGFDTISLSAAAQQYLNSLSGSTTSTSDPSTASNTLSLTQYLDSLDGSGNTSSDPTSTTSATNSSSETFTLSTAQQNQIESILEKYKGQPLTQDTFNKIQDDLKSAGLSADQLSAKDQVVNFNATQLLIQALSGTLSSTDPTSVAGVSASDEQTKSSNYMQQVQALWQSMDASSDPTATADASSSTSIDAPVAGTSAAE